MTVLGVVVPVHDEEVLLGGCLEALARAARWVRGSAEVRTVVVLDSCRDASREIAREYDVDLVALAARNVGAARDAGFRALLDAPGAVPDWIATTDADSHVPPDWLLAQLAAYERGADARVGAVYVDDWDDHGRSAREWFRTVYDTAADPHPHVHGANLGVRREAYERCGGFRGLAVGEDVALVAALDADGAVHRSRRSPVLTSGRRLARAAGGFATRLGELEAG
ncbi:glycosyltransferase family 2 protein [Actinomycetospora sp. NBRC 106378]|uniref:glycosyltransferase n=1 Tax=Actinomycetospora sp. NBRC 106378 TaxID=3032208 RepID=UPI0024A2C980|nr:glycosyltransferase family 2 protein [Actinomycetospora sp. NBRC 106378]GLZ55723.1 glycosyl transferase [Actinomycetospora sp. NBRC 106378]